jgi:hypothetical protein
MRLLDSSRVSVRPYIPAKEILSGISCSVYQEVSLKLAETIRFKLKSGEND